MISYETVITRVNSFWGKLGRILAIAGGAIVIFMTLSVVADVSRRFLFNNPIKGAVEALELALPYVIFLALAYTLAIGGHVRVTLIYGRFPRKLQLWADVLTSLTSMFLLSLLVWGGWKFFWVSFVANEYMMAEVFLPWWVGKFALPLGFFIFIIQFLINLLTAIGQLTNKIAIKEVKETILAG